MNVYVSNLYPKPAVGTLDQRLTADDTSGGVQFSAFAAQTDLVMFDVQGADVMVTFDGSAPTPTNGIRLYDTRAYTWSKSMATAAKFIRQDAVSAALHAQELCL